MVGFYVERIKRERAGGRKCPKPRTNGDAAEYWAAHALVDGAVARDGDVNSILIERDVIYSFGRHYPMGRIGRNTDGRCVEIILNADYYPSRGFASTPTDQGNVERAAHQAAFLSDWPIKVRTVFMSSYNLPNGVQVLPNAHDPKPLDALDMQVPRRFQAYEPGPEPVDTGEGCIAGTSEDYSYYADHMLLDEQVDENDRRITVRKRRYLYERKWYNGTIVWGSDSYDRSNVPGRSYIQCEHCKQFQFKHRVWEVLMHGGYHPQTYSKIKGWASYQANLHAHGGWEGWLEAFRVERARVKAARTAMGEWIERNFIPLDACMRDGHGVAMLHDDKYARRKDAAAYFKMKRERARQAARERREHERRMRERAQVERFKTRVKHRRAQRHARTFEGTVQRVVDDLRAIRESYVIPELPSTDTETPGGN